MDNNEKTFSLPKATLDKWLAALRSGEYEQGKETLETGDGKFCCLGVLQMVVDGKTEKGHCIPSAEWAETNRMLCLKYEFPDNNPRFAEVKKGQEVLSYQACADANDEGCTFIEIADAIEKACIPS